MTTPAPETVERERDKLFLTDAELIRRLGVPEKVARPVLRTMESRPGAPKRQPIWGNRWYWPAVERYLERMSGMLEEDKPQRRSTHVTAR